MLDCVSTSFSYFTFFSWPLQDVVVGAVVGAGRGRMCSGLALPSHQRRVLLLRLSAHAALHRRSCGPRDHRRCPQGTSAFRFCLAARLLPPEPLLPARLSSSGRLFIIAFIGGVYDVDGDRLIQWSVAGPYVEDLLERWAKSTNKM